MNTVQANMVVDVKNRLNTREGDFLTKEIARYRGVSSAQLSNRTARLVMVGYDAKVTEASRILDAFRNLGYDARLIGM